MDPISAFGLAVNILTVVDLSAKVISTASEIWSSGEPTSNHDRDLVAEHLRSCCKKIIGSGQRSYGKHAGGIASSFSSQPDVKLREIASEVAEIADDIQRSLIRRSKHGTITKTLRDSILVIWGEKKMREKTERLQTLRGELQFGVIVSLKSKLDVVALRTNDQLEKLDEMTRELVRTLLSDNENRRLDLEEHLAAIHKSVGRYVDQMEDTARQRHGELLNAILASSSQPPSVMTSDFQTLATEKVLDKLWFSRIDDRYEDISRAHRKTFEWIFSEDVELQPDCNFLTWAENGDGIYWMSGRAGTGKSTLMKFLADDVRMQKLFRLWAGDQGLVMSKYWFWDQSKDDLQKSLDGMYRGIMYELIRKEPLFAPLLFPDQFKAGRDWITDFPTSNELKRAFRRLVSAESPPVYVALLIDGLDEYRASEQAQLDLAQSLKIAAESKHLKIIASSRPETVFERTFKDSAKFYLHNLTRRDLELFITDKLQDHERMPYLAGIPGGEEARSQLISAAVERSEGIFLWLRLVVESLIQELDVCDQISDLRSVLDRFPRGLEALFLHMIRRMLGNSENRGLQCLWLMRRSLNVKSLQSPYITSKVGSVSTRRDTFQLTALCLEGAQMPFQTLVDLEPAKSGRFENTDTIYKMGNRMRSWCAGLLEMESGQGGGDPEISFIHRSVAEFLDLPSTRAELMDDMSKMANEDIDFSLMKGLLALIKKKARGEIFDTNSEVWYWVELIIRLARFIGDSYEEMTIVLLSEMDRTMAVYSNEYGQTRNDWTSYYPWAHVEVELYLRRPRRRWSFGDDSAGVNGLSGNADVVSMDEMARHILNAKDIISRAFIEAPKYRYVGSDEGLLGDFVPFEDVDSHWELDAETWGYTYGATYPPDAAPPPLAVADKEQIAQMGRALLETLDQKPATAKLGGTGREKSPEQQTASFARFREFKAKMHSRFRPKKS
ncbi:small s protein [Colletotrichum musicola]|uniref:Small s protein n=1 Tax=Colletotrichum musicola TaxID=2175873 RepID=A0A8H6KI81_9PEZI|nr:small s protein [Colletotrichum musicola]